MLIIVTCCQRSARRVEAGDVTTAPLPHGPYHNTGKLKASLCAGHGRRTRHWFGGTLWQIDLRETRTKKDLPQLM